MMNKKIALCAILGIIYFISGCANLNYSKPLAASSKISSNRAYIYGRFSLDKDFANMRRLALQLENTDTEKITSIRFLDEDPVYALSIEPGTYKLIRLVYAPLGAMMDFETTKMDLPYKPSYLRQPIKVHAGTCYYLGDFFGVSRRENLWAFVASSLGATAAEEYVNKDNIPIEELRLKYGLVGIKQEFILTTEIIKKSINEISLLSFEPAWN